MRFDTGYQAVPIWYELESDAMCSFSFWEGEWIHSNAKAGFQRITGMRLWSLWFPEQNLCWKMQGSLVRWKSHQLDHYLGTHHRSFGHASVVSTVKVWSKSGFPSLLHFSPVGTDVHKPARSRGSLSWRWTYCGKLDRIWLCRWGKGIAMSSTNGAPLNRV